LLCDLEFSLLDGGLIFALFGSQLFFPSTAVRYCYVVAYIALSMGLLATRKSLRVGLGAVIREGGLKEVQSRN